MSTKSVDYYINMIIDNPDYCDSFYNDPLINPITGHKITEGKDTYNKLKSACEYYTKEILGLTPPILLSSTTHSITPSSSSIPRPSMSPSSSSIPKPSMSPSSSLIPKPSMNPSSSSIPRLSMNTSSSSIPRLSMNTSSSSIPRLSMNPSSSSIPRLSMNTSSSSIPIPSARSFLPTNISLSRFSKRPSSNLSMNNVSNNIQQRSLVSLRKKRSPIKQKDTTEDIGPRLSGVPNDIIKNICNKMSIGELENFVGVSSRNMELCYGVLRNKVINEQKIKIREIINDKLKNIPDGYILDISDYDIVDPDKSFFGKYLKVPNDNSVPVFDENIRLYIDKNKLNRLKQLLEL